MAMNALAWPPFRRPEDDPVLWFHLNGGGKLACFGESTRRPPEIVPWLVLHGGPGGRINSSLVAPLRRSGLPWFGLDQWCSGASEDLHLDDIDLQRFVDDQMTLINHLQLRKVNVLAGSWGATVALAMGAQHAEWINAMVLRAPFVPFRQRVDAFFQRLRAVDSLAFDSVFSAPNVSSVCSLFEPIVLEAVQLQAAHVWSSLESGLLSGLTSSQTAMAPPVSSSKADALLRKYRLQAHFLRHDCFWSQEDLTADIQNIDSAEIPLVIVQGSADQVCPLDGAEWLHSRIRSSRLEIVPEAGHLAGDAKLARVIEGEVKLLARV